MKQPNYSPLLSAEDEAALTRMTIGENLKVLIGYMLVFPIWMIWLEIIPVAVVVMLLVALYERIQLARAVDKADVLKGDSLVGAEWGTIRSQLFLPALNMDVSERWLMIPLIYFILPFLLVDLGIAATTPHYFALLAMRARTRQEQGSPTWQLFSSWYSWVWNALFPAVLIAQNSSRVSAYSWERDAEGGKPYWWHAHGVFTGTHAIVDGLARSEQPRTVARASFKAVVPQCFPPGLLIFLPNESRQQCQWQEIRRAFHQAWLDEAGAGYQERLKRLAGLLRESWKNPSLEALASESISALVSRSIFFVFFGVWVTEEEADVLALWRGLASFFVMPRLVHRLALNITLYPIMSLRAQTLGIVRKYSLEPIFSRMNASLSPQNRRPLDVQLYDEVMFAIGFAGIGGTTAGSISTGKFLMARNTADVKGGVDFGGRGQAEMIALFQQSPRKFIQETCRISAPVGTFTSTLKQAQDLGILGGGLSPAGTFLAGVINMANLDPAVFPEPMRFEPSRPNLDDALTWNGKAFGAEEGKYPRICPGRYLAIEIISALANIAFGAPTPPPLRNPAACC